MVESLTPLQALDRFERRWRESLGAVNLVGEFEVPEQQATLVLRAVALLARKPRRRPELRRYPACVAVALSAFAGARYSGGALWDSLFSSIDVQDTPEVRTAIGDAFLGAIKQLDLPMGYGGKHYVGPITFHAVIPDYCLRDVLMLLAERLRSNPSLDGHSFLAWAAGHPSRLSGVDKPAARFLVQGGEYAADLVDRLLDLLVGLGDRLTDPQDLIALSGAPARMVRKAIDLAESEGLAIQQGSRRGALGKRSGSIEGPHVVLDLGRSSMILRLPQWDARNDDPVRWRVALDGSPSEVRGTMGRNEEVVIARPVRSLSAGLGNDAHVFDIDLVRAEFPLLAFDRLGNFVAGSNPLPDDQVWLLYPEAMGAPLADGIPLVPDIRLMGPVGWNGWTLDRTSLTEYRHIGYGDHTRAVHHRGRPQLEYAEPFLGLRTRSGLPLQGQRPHVSVPRLATSTDWRVEVRDATTGEVVSDERWTSEPRGLGPDLESWIDVFDGWALPVVGEFDILVRGPLGTRASWRLAVAEGLQQRVSVYCRTFVSGGLTPVRVDWATAAGLVVSPGRHEFGIADRRREVTVRAGSASLNLECEPNHLEVCRVSEGEAGEWAAAPLALPSDGPGDLGILEVRMAVPQALPPLRLVCESGFTQTLPATGGAGARQRFDLARIVDTLRAEKVGRLQWPIADGEKTTLATFRPDRLCSGVATDGGDVILRDFAGVSDAVAGVYQVLAPWRPPVILRVSAEGRSQVSDELAVAGPLVVLVRMEDPWAPAPWPGWPNKALGDKAYSLHREGWPEPSDDAEGGAIHYLAGIIATPSNPASLPYLWAAWERANELIENGAPTAIREEIPAQLMANPSAAVEALLSTDLSRDTALVMSMGAGLFVCRPALSENSLRALWRRFPALASAVGVGTAALPWDEIVAVCGDLVESVAGGATDWSPHVGRFDHAAILNAKTPTDLATMWREARVVPAGLLDIDTRAAAGMALFQARKNGVFGSMTRDGEALVHAAEGILRDSGHDALRGWLQSRSPVRSAWDWEVIPQLSAVFAAMARAAARGEARAVQFSARFVDQWQSLARAAPQIVEIDIVLAEMLARAATDPYHRPADPIEGPA